MAIVKGPIVMTGGFGNASFYTVRGSNKVIVRTKGGASKEKIKTSPKFAGLRKQQKEWSACAKFGSVARYALGGLHRLADYNITPILNGMGKNLMKLDIVSEIGRRELRLTTYKQALEGFNLNRNYPFNTVLRVMPRLELNRDKLETNVHIPRINTAIDLLNIQKLPFFRLIVSIGIVSDLEYNTKIDDYEPIVPRVHGISQTNTGAWHSTQTILPEHIFTVAFGETEISDMTNDATLLVCMAVEFGNVGFTGEPVEVKYAGSAKVIAVG
ncbi:MAG: hypothetical protein ACOYMD_13680 [Paludibacter sp.]